MRIFEVFCNNGDWSGHFSLYKIASSLEEAKELFKEEMELYGNRGYDVFPVTEVKGYHILRNFQLNNGEYELEYKIKKKESQ